MIDPSQEGHPLTSSWPWSAQASLAEPADLRLCGFGREVGRRVPTRTHTIDAATLREDLKLTRKSHGDDAAQWQYVQRDKHQEAWTQQHAPPARERKRALWRRTCLPGLATALVTRPATAFIHPVTLSEDAQFASYSHVWSCQDGLKHFPRDVPGRQYIHSGRLGVETIQVRRA